MGGITAYGRTSAVSPPAGGRPVETADIVVLTALCEIVYEIPISR